MRIESHDRELVILASTDAERTQRLADGASLGWRQLAFNKVERSKVEFSVAPDRRVFLAHASEVLSFDIRHGNRSRPVNQHLVEASREPPEGRMAGL